MTLGSNLLKGEYQRFYMLQNERMRYGLLNTLG